MIKNPSQLSDILKKLLYENRMYPADLANAIGLPGPTIHRLVTGKSTRPYRSSLEPIARFFSITIEQLLGKEPIRWVTENSEQLEELGIYRVPLLNWNNVFSWLNETTPPPMTSPERLLTEISVGLKAFALTVKDSSMTPLFPPDTQVIFDPEKPVKDRCYVLVQLENLEEPVFRQIILDAGDKFLKPLSPDLEHFRMHMVEKNDIICGTLVEAKKQYSQ